MADVTKTRMHAEEFLALPESNLPIELIDGEVIMSPSPKDIHQKVVGLLHQLLVKLTSGGEIRLSPMDVHLDDLNILQPDIFWVSGPDSLCQLGEDGYWHGAPDLVVEVLSEATTLRDRREKFNLYEKHGSREYWIVDTTGRYVEVWQRIGEQLQRVGVYAADESFESPLLGGKVVDLKAILGN